MERFGAVEMKVVVGVSSWNELDLDAGCYSSVALCPLPTLTLWGRQRRMNLLSALSTETHGAPSGKSEFDATTWYC